MKKNLYDIIRILTIIVATVLINAVLGTVVAFAYSEDVNSLMNASSYIIVQDDSSTREDPMYYKSAFITYEEMKYHIADSGLFTDAELNDVMYENAKRFYGI